MSMSLSALLPDQQLPEHLAGMEIGGLAMDSRKVSPGDLFFAMPGHQTDGRRFIRSAIDAGAALVLEDGDTAGLREEQQTPVLTLPGLVSDLGYIAARFHGNPGAEMTMIGVTGTNGKSSVAWFVHDALNALGQPCALVGTLGVRMQQWQQAGTHTTPDALQVQSLLAECRRRGAQAVIMEVSSHALVQQRLNGVPFSSAIFTNLSRDHLDYHGDMDSYFSAKARLFAWPDLSLAVINTGDQWGRRLCEQVAGSCHCVTFGADDADVRCLESRFTQQGLELSLMVSGRSISLSLPLFGAFNRDNVLAVAALLTGQGVTDQALLPALQGITPVPGRMEPVIAEQGPTVIVDYAHTPDALEKALRACRQHFSGALWCVAGCGGNRDQGKRPLMAAAACELADRVILTSDNPRDEAPEEIIRQMCDGVPTGSDVLQIVDRRQAIMAAIASASRGDVVLVAGKGHEDYQEVAGQRLPFDDRQVAAEALRQWRSGGGA